MYRRCYRYDDQTPVVTHIEDQPVSEPLEETPSVMTKEQREKLENQPYEVVHSAPKETKSSIQSEHNTETKTASLQSITTYMKQLYDRTRHEIMKNGKVLGILETDDLVIILLIVLLLAEDCDDYILLLALAALLFMK